MYIFLTILLVVAAILVTLLVLVQNSKGGGLASGFASGNQVMGAPKTADFLEKATWVLVGIIVLLSIAAVGASKSSGEAQKGDSQVIEAAAEVAAENAAAEAAPAFDAEEAE